MFPLYDENPTRITPYFTYGLIGINIVVFLHEVSLSNAQLSQFLSQYAVVPQELTTNLSGEWITLFTSQFLHGGWWHLISNMLFLWVFGNNIEDRLGHAKYLIFYLTCGALAALCQWFIGMNSEIPSLGASGAISGVLGAYIIRFPHAKVMTLVFGDFHHHNQNSSISDNWTFLCAECYIWSCYPTNSRSYDCANRWSCLLGAYRGFCFWGNSRSRVWVV